MDDPSMNKRSIDFGSNNHEYDGVQGQSEEPSYQPQQPTASNNLSCNNPEAGAAASAFGGGTPVAHLQPEHSPAKHKSVKSSKNKQKQKSANKSKIPRSPSLASSLSSLASSLTKNVPPQTPPLPANYQQKSKFMNGGSGGGSMPVEPLTAITPTSPHHSANDQSDCTSHIMGGGIQMGTENATTISGSAPLDNLALAASPKFNRRPQQQTSLFSEPTTPMTPSSVSPINFQYLTLTVRKDENGYGMKVSGDNPVFVESVKAGGAAQIAGLVAGDMILKVNGQEVRMEKHPTVVSLIKASSIVELAVKRNQKITRPTSVGIVPSTPVLSGRDRTASITGPQPVDSIKRREMETYKIQTLQKMLEQEKINLERLKGDTNNPSYKLSEANIRKLREQLRQVGAEDAPTLKYQPTTSNKSSVMLLPNQIQRLSASATYQNQQTQHHHNLNNNHQQLASTPQPAHFSPAFLSLLPRSLSSLSLGTRKNKTEKDMVSSPLSSTTDFLHTQRASQQGMKAFSPDEFNGMSQSLHQHATTSGMHQNLLRNSPQLCSYQQQQNIKDTPKSIASTKGKPKFTISKSLIEEDIPPPLPQRNLSRQLNLDFSPDNSSHSMQPPVSDLDRATSPQLNLPLPLPPHPQMNNAAANAKSKRTKIKTKALSDPKMSTQIFLQMETVSSCGAASADKDSADGCTERDCAPPPLPPRQPGMQAEELHRSGGSMAAQRVQPNSVGTVFNYPLVATCTAVQNENLAAAFPLSHRPNIVQQLQHHKQQTLTAMCAPAALGLTPKLSQIKHRRVGSSPDNMHARHPDRLLKTTSGSWELMEKDGEITPPAPGTPPPPYLTSSHVSVPEEPNGNCDNGTGNIGIYVESHHFTPMMGISSPMAHGSRIQAAQSTDTQKEIISMEDENSSDQEEPFIDENGPFNNMTRLLEAENVVFLAVFLNYVLSNSEPAPLLFYLITELYKEGTSKDMRKWAYEIHSTFLVPRAPLSWYRQDETLAREVDNVLQSEYDKVEMLRTVFLRSRKRAKDLISEQLREFQQKRTAGLGTIYGPTDDKLAEARADKQRELIIEKYLMPNLQLLIEEYEKDLPVEDARKLAMCSALSTVIHRIFNTRSNPNSIVDRVHHFVSREKSFKSRIMSKNRKMIVRGHSLVLRQYHEVTHCNHCQTIIWGVSPQGYHCTDCKLNIHRSCSKVLEENCPGPVPQAKRHPHNDNKISKFMGKIRPRASDFAANERRARQDEELDADISSERLHSSSIVRQPSDRRADMNISSRYSANASANSSSLNVSDLQTSFHSVASPKDVTNGNTNIAEHGTNVAQASLASNLAGTASPCTVPELNIQDPADCKDIRRDRPYRNQQNKSAPVSVNRSESYKERISNKRNRNNHRKTSDPSLAPRTLDDQTDVGLSNFNYTASSDSSLSSAGNSESPSISIEQMAGAGLNAMVISSQHPHLSIQQQNHQDLFPINVGSTSIASNTSFSTAVHPLHRQWNLESDEEEDLNEADWSSMVASEMIATLSDAEKKRQEIINEIYQTERNHVRTLKLLDRLFFLPLRESGLLSQDYLLLLFPPALLSLRELHGTFEQQLKHRRIEHNHIVSHVGDLLTEMFDGQSGDVLCGHAAQFCARQQIALEALKEKRHKDEQLQKLLKKAESHKACRRLELKDLLPTVLQRLTKYPLLFENLYKVTLRVTPENISEAEAIKRALDSCKKILVEVNKAVKTAEDTHKLQNIQRKLDKSSYDKDEFKKLDLTQHRLIHDGNLTMKKNPSIQLHGLLFENMIVLLTKQDDKYSLKNLHTPLVSTVSPIMNIDSETLCRQEAADKNSFFLIKTKTSQMLELRAPSSSECKTWFKHISDAVAQQYKPRTKNANNQSSAAADSAVNAMSQPGNKDAVELSAEQTQPMTLTANNAGTTPLSPMLPVPMSTPSAVSHRNYEGDEKLGNNQRDMMLNDNAEYYNIGKEPQSNNEDSPPSYYNIPSADLKNVSLRSNVSIRQSDGDRDKHDERGSCYELVGGPSKRDSASIICSNNSNNTRTLLMQSPLVEPTAIQISISPSHTAEPVLTPGEQLRRLDASIRTSLLEKQKIICDIFRLPLEHYNEIVDIAMMPETPKDSSDIVLAAYDQVQTLTKLVNQYMQVTPDEIISAVSTTLCDHCNEKENNKSLTTAEASSPPPLPPPNRTPAQAQPQMPKFKLQAHSIDEVAIHEDDDGYCEIDELRLPAIHTNLSAIATPLAPFKSGVSERITTSIELTATTSGNPATSERLSIDNTESTCASSQEEKLDTTLHVDSKSIEVAAAEMQLKAESETANTESNTNVTESIETGEQVEKPEDKSSTSASVDSTATDDTTSGTQVDSSTTETVQQPTICTAHIEINEVYDTLAEPSKTHVSSSMVDNFTQTAELLELPKSPVPTHTESMKGSVSNGGGHIGSCGPNRIQHACKLQPTVPCHALSGIVSALNEQISLLLPKINERDLERERLRKENQHLRELLGAMHERQRVDTKNETPTDINTILQAADAEFEDEFDAGLNTSLTLIQSADCTHNSPAAKSKDT